MSEVKEEKKEEKQEDKMDIDSEDTEESSFVARRKPEHVTVHPLVLLSVVDHYNRVAKDTKRRVCGILLGEVNKGRVDVTNSYAVPFEEDPKDASIWFFDHNYHEQMFNMFKKVNAKEKVVGWYSTGRSFCPADLDVNELIRNYTRNPVYVLVDVTAKNTREIPTRAYLSVKNNVPQGHPQTFMHLPSEIGAYEAEEVGVEHLLRDVRSEAESTVAGKVSAKLNSLLGLEKRMQMMHQYLENVISGRIPANHQIIYNMQDIFNLSPDTKVKKLVDALSVKTNDNQLVVYLSSLIRSITALHDLINNKFDNIQAEKREKEAKEGKKKQGDAAKEEAKKKEEQAAKDGKGKKDAKDTKKPTK